MSGFKEHLSEQTAEVSVRESKSDLAAVATGNTAFLDVSNRIVAQRIIEHLDRKRWAAGEPNAGVVTGAHILINAELRHGNAFTVLNRCIPDRPLAPLPVQHALR